MEKSPSWSRAHDWKSCRPLKGLEGSNPSFSAIQNPVIVMVTGFLSCFFLYFFLNSPLLLFGHGNRLNKPLHPLSGLPAHLPGGEGADIQRKSGGSASPIPGLHGLGPCPFNGGIPGVSEPRPAC